MVSVSMLSSNMSTLNDTSAEVKDSSNNSKSLILNKQTNSFNT